MTISAAEAAMFERFRTQVQNTHDYPTKYGNGKYVNADESAISGRLPALNDGAFFRVTTNSAESAARELGPSPKVLHSGQLVVAVNAPTGTGDATLRTLCEAVKAAFSHEKVGSVEYLTPTIGDRIEASGWAQRTVRCPYRVFE